MHTTTRLRQLLCGYLVAAILVCPVVGASPAPVALKVSPRVSAAPTTIRFTITIEPNKDNRKVCLTYDGGEAGMSCWQVDGDTHARTQWFERRIGRGGEYFATLTLVSIVCDAKDECAVKHQTVTAQFVVTEPGNVP